MFFGLATYTFSLFAPGEAYFLQFTALLQRVSTELRRALAVAHSLADFAACLRGNTPLLPSLCARPSAWISDHCQPEEGSEVTESAEQVNETEPAQPTTTQTPQTTPPPQSTSLLTPSPCVPKTLLHQLTTTFLPSKPDQTPRLLFRSTAQTTLTQLLDAARGRSNTLLVVVTAEDEVLGCCQEEPWRYAASFYGSGKSVVFRVCEDERIESFEWSKVNSFFQLSTETKLVVGGGNRHAIFLDATLKHGASGECLTYKSPPLAGCSEFECAVVELWCSS